jgi:hypothetical protein
MQICSLRALQFVAIIWIPRTSFNHVGQELRILLQLNLWMSLHIMGCVCKKKTWLNQVTSWRVPLIFGGMQTVTVSHHVSIRDHSQEVQLNSWAEQWCSGKEEDLILVTWPADNPWGIWLAKSKPLWSWVIFLQWQWICNYTLHSWRKKNDVNQD